MTTTLPLFDYYGAGATSPFLFGHPMLKPNMALSPTAIHNFFVTHNALTCADSPLHESEHRDDVLRHLEAYRMAATNLPRKDAEISASWDELNAVLAVVPGLLEHVDVTRQQAADSAKMLGKPTSDPFDCSQQDKMHLVTPGIYVGSYHPACDLAMLKKHGITHVLSCIELDPRFPDDFTYLVAHADDKSGYDMTKHFTKTFDFIEDAIASGGSVLVHCGAGVSRAPSTVAAYLIRKLQISAESAMMRVRAARACSVPNQGFQRQLRELAQRMLNERRLASSSSDDPSADV